MKILVNSEPVELAEPCTLEQLLELRGQRPGTATAVNGSFVARAARATLFLSEGDEVEIVAPMQGG